MAGAHEYVAVVVMRDDPEIVVGHVTVAHLLEGRLRDLLGERHRERILRPRAVWPRRDIALAPAADDIDPDAPAVDDVDPDAPRPPERVGPGAGV